MMEQRKAALLVLFMAVLAIWFVAGSSAFFIEGREDDRAMHERELEMIPPAQPGATYATEVYWGQKASANGDRADEAFRWQLRALFLGIIAPISLALITWASILVRRRLVQRRMMQMR